ncbi:UNVERIFIED_CONTAM: Acid phosphatase 1 [Sesamum angustifolium]|uniref:Acid phosphatase 1 n=1 Tax=Sesamum angustifolium TaxID=2727405 RepID=A0AAW2PV08_9LAMI
MEKIPEECADYVKEYMIGKGYELDLQRVSNEAKAFARSVYLSGDGNSAWIFDVDETLLSNLPYYAQHGFGLEVFDSTKFGQWVEMGIAPVIESSLELYEEVLSLDSRSSEDHEKTATVYKSEKRSELVEQGYQILGNSGDQWSDLLGSSMSIRSFKLPNPMYYISYQVSPH